MRSTRRSTAALGTATALTLLITSCGGGSSSESAPDVAAPSLAGSDELDELIAAAQEENCLTLYGVPDEAALSTLTDAFTAEYDIPVSVVRLVSADLTQRFSTEAEAGAVAADVVLLTHSPFYADAYSRGWLTPMDQAEIPAFPGEFPEGYTADDGRTPIVQLVPTSMVYNPGLVEEAPESWEAYADPAFAGELLFAEPTSSPANVSFWQLMRDTYGDDFLEAVAANGPSWYNSAVPATQAVAAGEGSLGFPGVTPIVANLQSAGAPVELAQLSPTTGPEIAVGLAADSPCGDAGRLFANYVLSEEGNTYLNELTGDISPFADTADDFVRPTPVPDAQAQEIRQLLGAP
ncbi:ABC transporter substrate-binding protein [Klenkia taihuensis]|uniref:Iron(III) transport system substrate-binding protein n=1 Tax=Klenkia taihuensis TaxID=1225127 RepID=A0A1I1PY74_9ACTN|nr:extracellular solute-binding protein [Klenkia taihuensis]GHE08353.1 ABC transporter substrate-binding protein [Klenkia taihuensis]SFD14657.1 iron(III) transport system substrate-binding protein [Klenkia taihuensis]